MSPAPAPIGDPPQERNGTVPEGQATPRTAPTRLDRAHRHRPPCCRYALAYTNWQAASLTAHERELASLAVGAARLAAEQTAASESAAAALAANHVQNKGVVLAIAPGKGPARGQWVVVTQEQTTGTGPYAGLPPSAHVTLARTARVHARWVISEWRPESRSGRGLAGRSVPYRWSLRHTRRAHGVSPGQRATVRLARELLELGSELCDQRRVGQALLQERQASSVVLDLASALSAVATRSVSELRVNADGIERQLPCL